LTTAIFKVYWFYAYFYHFADVQQWLYWSV